MILSKNVYQIIWQEDYLIFFRIIVINTQAGTVLISFAVVIWGYIVKINSIIIMICQRKEVQIYNIATEQETNDYMFTAPHRVYVEL